MTEDEWLADGIGLRMFADLEPDPSGRKMRLFGVACCRRIWHLLDDDRSRTAVEVAERFADGLATEEERELAAGAATTAFLETADDFSTRRAAAEVIDPAARFASHNAAAYASSMGEYEGIHESEMAWQARILRCIVGNPFRPVSLEPSWLTSNATSLAHAVYDQRHLPSGLLDTERMGVLADALEEAGFLQGCDNAVIHDHLRSGGDHVKGCFAIDLLLGKK